LHVFTGVAQLVEHWSPKPGVGSSSLSTRAILLKRILMKKIKKFIEDVRKEMAKVSWPTQQELIDNTIIVVVFTIIVSTFIFGVDQVYSTILEAIYR